jgi:putative addiction module antidote
MNLTIKLTRVGNSTGAVFPKELLARLRVGPGDTVYVSETPDGGVEAKMAAAEAIMREDRDILRVLAK